MSVRSSLGRLKRAILPSKSRWPDSLRVRFAMNQFKREQGYRFDIEHPGLFTEKVIWYKLFYHREKLERIVDKYLFKDYIREKLGEGYTIPLLGAWDNIDDFTRDWDGLPEEFCLKSTLMSDGKCIKFVHHKSQEDREAIIREVKSWLNPKNTLINSFCRAYYHALPRVLAEEYKTEINNQLYDYKVFCFDGVPDCVYVATDHFPGQISHISFYDLDWNRLDVHYGKHPNCEVPKPRELEEMLRISRILSKDFPFVRVDFFETAEHLYVAELTLYPGGGLTPIYPESFSRALGDKFRLPER